MKRTYVVDHNWNKSEKPCGGGGIKLGVMYNMRPKVAARYLKRKNKS